MKLFDLVEVCTELVHRSADALVHRCEMHPLVTGDLPQGHPGKEVPDKAFFLLYRQPAAPEQLVHRQLDTAAVIGHNEAVVQGWGGMRYGVLQPGHGKRLIPLGCFKTGLLQVNFVRHSFQGHKIRFCLAGVVPHKVLQRDFQGSVGKLIYNALAELVQGIIAFAIVFQGLLPPI